MRDELHLMELVDRYLDEAMGAEERAAFEGRMRANNDLRTLVDDQRALREGFQRLHLRTAATAAHRAWLLRRWVPWAAAVVLVIAGAVLLLDVPAHEAGTDKPEPPRAAELPQERRILPCEETAPAEVGDAEPGSEPASTSAPMPTDSVRGEGRIVTHLITKQADGNLVDTLISSVPYVVSAPEQEELERLRNGPTRPGDVDSTFSSAAKTEEQRSLMYTVEEVPEGGTAPMFPGGVEAMNRFVSENVRQPRGSQEIGVVVVSFNVNRKGEVEDPEVTSGMGRAFDAEALRVVRRMPPWKPAHYGDRVIKSRVNLLIRFAPKVITPPPDRRQDGGFDR